MKIWADLINSMGEAYTLSIARKCPRILEVLIREGLLDKSYLNQVFSEHALPFHFSTGKSHHTYKLCDDSIIFGSTYRKIERLLNTFHGISQRLDGGDIAPLEVIKLPASVVKGSSVKINPEHTPLVFENEDDSFSFVNREMSAFLRGGPYDIEFPLVTVEGKFEVQEIDKLLNEIVQTYNAEKPETSPEIELPYKIVHPVLLKDKSIQNYVWTIVFEAINKREVRGPLHPEFSKIRFFLNKS
ncbi:MAG: hypothetical protein LUG98_05675 [Tannerellaceae bacterium]|nr:hypothetical protein [Tannerellaceae bacterium]